MLINFKGFRRPDGSVGTRNHVLILPTIFCANKVANNIALQVGGTCALPHSYGCGHLALERDHVKKILSEVGKNPNVGAVLVVGLGCEQIPAPELAEEIAASKKPIADLTIQKCGGTLQATQKGIKIGLDLVNKAKRFTRQEVSVRKLNLGVVCGGSDFSSGLASNPALGKASDTLIKEGGTVILSETAELMGAEHILAERAVNKQMGEQIYEITTKVEKQAKEMGVDIRGAQPNPGNMKGGLTTIEEKSLGAIQKGGSSSIVEVLEYGDTPSRNGLYIMDTPGQDLEQMAGMLAGGVQLIAFTTGRGTPLGNPIAPVIKITGNPETYKNMMDNMDLNAGTIITGRETIDEVGQKIWSKILSVASGELTKAEILGHKEFGVARLCPSI